MGEVVAHSWSDEDAILFHEVVYSNHVTLGRNFWKHLEAAFFSQTKPSTRSLAITSTFLSIDEGPRRTGL